MDAKYKKMKENEVRYKTYMLEDAKTVIIAYGTAARIALSAIKKARKKGIKAGLIRPISLFPFPEKIIKQTANNINKYLVVEMSTGQMVEDVKLATEGKVPVHFYGKPGGILPSPQDITEKIEKIRGE